MTGWDALARHLCDPATHGLGRDGVRVVETHTAIVVLAGERAWKLRRPVDYGWLDYGTLERRRAMAEAEIAKNAPTAPGLYLGLGGLIDGPGGPRLIGPGETVPQAAEPLVVMARFPEEARFDRMAETGRIDAALLHATGRAVAAMHGSGAPAASARRVMDVAGLVRGEIAGLEDLAADLGEAAVGQATAALRSLAERAADAPPRPARVCHGDLHLGNIVLWRGRPTPFDCIEFNPAISEIDPLYDLAFLAMDLEHRGLGSRAPRLLSAWAEAVAAAPGIGVATAYGGLGLWPLYRAIRAAIRAKVHGLTARHAADPAHAETGRADARRYLARAAGYAEPRPPPHLIAVGGHSGSGKSTLAHGLAALTGGIVIRSDGVRKGLWGVEETDPLPASAYGREATETVYAAMRLRGAMALAGGMTVILDATHADAAQRAEAEALARDRGLGFSAFWLEADAETLGARLDARSAAHADASDADRDVLARQLARGAGSPDWPRLATDGPPGSALAEAARRLDLPLTLGQETGSAAHA